ncbi:MAG: hypothetical protein KJ770_02750 [Actinobacteria bacterium]|nr:hypothetical protein [Actinomycetota bacterium]MCG2789471.1 hypothetical protein [Actinomycetes bacterium]
MDNLNNKNKNNLKKKKYLAFDLGQSGSRVILGEYNGGTITLKEIYRFIEYDIYAGGYLQWNILKIYNEVLRGVGIALKSEEKIESIGIDSWGSDYSFIDKNGYLLGNPITNRDKSKDKAQESFYNIISKRELFKLTGVQLASTSSTSLLQLYVLKYSKSGVLNIADKYLMIPGIINYFLTGNVINEYTLMSFSQLINQKDKKISDYILKKFDIPGNIFPEIVYPGTEIGTIQKDVCSSIGIKPLKIIATAQHDTASAFTAVPLSPYKNIAAISIGTWCCLGIATEIPIITDEAYDKSFANQAGVEGVNHFRKDFPGMMITEQYRKQIMRDMNKEISWKEIDYLVENAPKPDCFIDIVNPIFSNPTADMYNSILKFFKETGQQIPQTAGELFRCIYQSIALFFRSAIEELEKIIGKKIEFLYLVGGGSKNKLLCQWTANLLKIPVLFGIYEATSIGNILIQMKSSGEISSYEEGNLLIKDSFKLEECSPQETDKWEVMYENFLRVLKK